MQNVIANQLVSQGFYEIMANSLTNPDYIKLSEQLKEEHNVTMLNPLSNDLSVLRQSLLFSGLESISHNINRRQSNLKFFEFGKTYHNYSNAREEHKHLTLFVTGNKKTERWNTENKTGDFYYLKGTVDTILSRLGISRARTAPIKNDVFSEGLS